MRNASLILLVASICGPAAGRSACADPARLFAESDEVLDIHVLGQKKLKAGDLDCGTQYRAKVVTAAKGPAQVSDTIRFNGWAADLQRDVIYRVYLRSDRDGSFVTGLLEADSLSSTEARSYVQACWSKYRGTTLRALKIIAKAQVDKIRCE